MKRIAISGCFTVLAMILSFCAGLVPIHAAQFTADLVITGPRENYTFKLYVKEDMYRLKKASGPMKYPPFPTIVNRKTGLTWGLNPQMRQYVEVAEPERSMMMNPLVGWAMTRKGMTMSQGGTEKIGGYQCQTFEYREPGESQLAAKVWVATKLDFPIKEVRYGVNANPTMELKNIKEGPVNTALFKIPAGYTKVAMVGGAPKAAARPSTSLKPKVETVTVKKGQGRGRSVDPDRRIVITATGDGPTGEISKARLIVKDLKGNDIESALFALKKNQARTWEIPAEKSPSTVSVTGEEGQIRFKVEQFAVEGPLISAQETTPAKAAKPPAGASTGNLIFILDASGSMWGQVEGKAKIVIAKEVLTGLIKDLPDDATVGLVAYGHRRKGDCNDVEELVPLGPINKNKLIKIVQGLGAKGKTPITLSVRKTAQKLKGLKEETTIILVSDGKETCEGDPCALVKELKAAGIKFVMHVIGFDVTEEERAQLECMAQAGDGEYFTAKTAKDFQMAATEVVKKAQKPYGILRVTVMKNGKPFFAPIQVLDAESGQQVLASSSSGKTGIRNIRLDPGAYHMEVSDTTVSGGKAPVIRHTGIVIEAGKTVEKTADFSDGTLVIKAIKNERPFEAKVFYYRSGEGSSFHNESTHPKTGEARRKFVPGTYNIKVVDSHTAGNPSINLRGIEVLPGKTIEKTAEFANGTLRIRTTKNGQPVFCPVKIFDPEGKVISDFWTQKGERTVQLLQGTYDVEVKLMDIPGGNPVIRFRGVEIKARGTGERTADFKIGFLAVSATLDGKPFNTPVKLYKESSKSNIGQWTSKGSRTFPLVPGVYNAKVVSAKDNKQFKAFEGIKIEAGKTVNINVAFPIAPQETKKAPKTKPQATAAPAPAAVAPTPPGSGEHTAGGGTIMGGEVPLYKGAKVLKEETYGPNAKVEMEVPAAPEEIINFYKEAMTAKGWQPGMARVQGSKGALMLNKPGKQLVISVRGQGETSRVSLGLVSQ
jgi:Ca-activated chloride channel family protein